MLMGCSSSKLYEQQKVDMESICSQCNVVVITVSNLRADHLLEYGYKRQTNPKLAGWMKNAVVFDSNYAVGKWPFQALISLATGMYPEKHQVFLNGYHNKLNFSEMNLQQDVLSRQFPVLSEVMKDNGYNTLFMGGEPHPSFYSPEVGFGRGVAEIIRQSLHNPEDLPILYKSMDKVTQGKFYANINTVRSHFPHFILPKTKKTVFQNPKYKGILPDNEEEYYRNIINCFDQKNSKCPIDFNKIPPETIKWMKFSTDLYNLISFSIRPGNMEDAQRMEDYYDESVAYNDEMIDGVFRYLEDKKLLENTIVVVTSEMGSLISPISDQHTTTGGKKLEVLFGYNSYQDAVTHTPLMIYLPERARSSSSQLRISEMTNSTDLFPTILGLVGFKNPANVDGIDLSPLVAGHPMKTREYTHGLSFRPQKGVEAFFRNKDYIVYHDHRGEFGVDVRKNIVTPRNNPELNPAYIKMFSMLDTFLEEYPLKDAQEIRKKFNETYR